MKIVNALIILLACGTVAAQSVEHRLWEKSPIAIDLSNKDERIVQFSQPIKILDNEAGDKLSALKVRDTLYLKGNASFSKQKLIVELIPAQEVVILLLSADDKEKSLTPVAIEIESKTPEPSKTATAAVEVNPIAMTRFAIQALYSPKRLVSIPSGLSRVPMYSDKNVSLFYGANLQARPLASWKNDKLYVTAVQLKNLQDKSLAIDLRQIIGNWQTAAFYPTNRLKARGKDDVTTIFLVSSVPFTEALNAPREFVR